MCEAEATLHNLPHNLAHDLCAYFWAVNGELNIESTMSLCYVLADKYSVKPNQVAALFSEITKIAARYGELILQELKC